MNTATALAKGLGLKREALDAAFCPGDPRAELLQRSSAGGPAGGICAAIAVSGCAGLLTGVQTFEHVSTLTALLSAGALDPALFGTGD